MIEEVFIKLFDWLGVWLEGFVIDKVFDEADTAIWFIDHHLSC